MGAGARLRIVNQAYLVWANRGSPALQRFVDTGSFGDEEDSDVIPYNADLVKAIVATGKLS